MIDNIIIIIDTNMKIKQWLQLFWLMLLWLDPFGLMYGLVNYFNLGIHKNQLVWLIWDKTLDF
jgi:hypothetical protein